MEQNIIDTTHQETRCKAITTGDCVCLRQSQNACILKLHRVTPMHQMTPMYCMTPRILRCKDLPNRNQSQAALICKMHRVTLMHQMIQMHRMTPRLLRCRYLPNRKGIPVEKSVPGHLYPQNAPSDPNAPDDLHVLL